MDDLPEVFKIESEDEEAPSGPVNKKLKTGDHQSRGKQVVNTDHNPEHKMLEGENLKSILWQKRPTQTLLGQSKRDQDVPTLAFKVLLL